MIRKGDCFPILLLALLWTPTFLLIKAVVLEAGPFTVSFIRFFLGASLLYLLSWGQWGNKRLFLNYKKELILASLLLLAFPFSVCAIGEMFIDASTAGIVEGAIPVFTLLFAKYWYKEGNIGAKEFGGIFLGLLGLLVIFFPTVHEGGWESFLGLGLLILMAIGFSAGFLYVEKHLKALPPLPTTTLLLFITSILLFPLALTKGGMFYGNIPSIDSLAVLILQI
jgi:drug/metabolite transporter (DMT)-like permease